MQSPRFACAAETARLLLAGGLRPTDDWPECLLLDLSSVTPRLAESVLQTVARALGPRLYLRGATRLLVISGGIGPHAAAPMFARSLDSGVRKTLRIGAVFGESVIDRLEEFSLAGCVLQDKAGHALLEEKNAPWDAWTPAPPPPVTASLADGAQVVFTRAAAPETFADAVTGQGIPPVGPQPLFAELLGHYRLEFAICFPDDSARDDWLTRLQSVSSDIRYSWELSGSSLHVSMESSDPLPLEKVAEQIELISLGAGVLEAPLVAQIRQERIPWRGTIPQELTEFGHDTRSAEEWIG